MNKLPAFPPSFGGLSRLDYFAAHAPAVPAKFKHKEPKGKRAPTHTFSFDEEERLKKMADYHQTQAEWETQDIVAREVQWRIVFAKAMCEALEKEELEAMIPVRASG